MTDHDFLSGELADFAPKPKAVEYSKEDRRIVLGFEEIQRFVDEHNRLPEDVPGRDIFERLYAVRLEVLRAHADRDRLLKPLDTQGIFDASKHWETMDSAAHEIDHADLAAALADFDSSDLTTLTHVRSYAERVAAEEVAQREKCPDFADFAEIFEQINRELSVDLREAVPFDGRTRLEQGEFYILHGQVAYIAEKGEEFVQDYGNHLVDARLRVVFDNGTQSALLMRSFQRALSQDERGRRITEPDNGPLFSGEWSGEDVQSGVIYVLRSLSEQPEIASRREVLHKIGVTTENVQRRISNAPNDATYLCAPVEIVAEYTLANIQRHALERLIHRIFAPARLDLVIEDRFGRPVRPKEWFLVPLSAIDEAVERIMDGSITTVRYDVEKAGFVKG